jgi:hypothetical protein
MSYKYKIAGKKRNMFDKYCENIIKKRDKKLHKILGIKIIKNSKSSEDLCSINNCNTVDNEILC